MQMQPDVDSPPTNDRPSLLAFAPLVANLLSLMLVPDPPLNFSFLFIGYFVGSIYAHAALAGVYAALGKGVLGIRLLLSGAWVLATTAAIYLNFAMNYGPEGVVIEIGGSLFGVCILLLLMFSLLQWRLGYRVSQREDQRYETGAMDRQYGIGDLLLLMTISAIAIGLGRLVLPMLPASSDLVIFLFLALSAALTTVPLVTAMLVKSFAPLAVIFSLLFVAAVSPVQYYVLEAIGSHGPEVLDLLAINLVSAVIILFAVGVVRFKGYRLYTGIGRVSN